MDIYLTNEDRLIVLRALENRLCVTDLSSEEDVRLHDLIGLISLKNTHCCTHCGFPIGPEVVYEGSGLCNVCWMEENHK